MPAHDRQADTVDGMVAAAAEGIAADLLQGSQLELYSTQPQALEDSVAAEHSPAQYCLLQIPGLSALMS